LVKFIELVTRRKYWAVARFATAQVPFVACGAKITFFSIPLAVAMMISPLFLSF
jgi:hypothetical protein